MYDRFLCSNEKNLLFILLFFFDFSNCFEEINSDDIFYQLRYKVEFLIGTIIFHCKLYSCNEAFHYVDQEVYIEINNQKESGYFDMKKINNYY